LFPAFAAVFFGSTQFKSRPNVWGTLLAVYTLAFGVKGLQLAFASGVYWITPLFNGVALVLAVALAARSGAIARRRRSLTGSSGAGAEHVPSTIQAHGELSGASPVEPQGDALRA
jgi:ribose transport system permease protein